MRRFNNLCQLQCFRITLIFKSDYLLSQEPYLLYTTTVAAIAATVRELFIITYVGVIQSKFSILVGFPYYTIEISS